MCLHVLQSQVLGRVGVELQPAQRVERLKAELSRAVLICQPVSRTRRAHSCIMARLLLFLLQAWVCRSFVQRFPVQISQRCTLPSLRMSDLDSDLVFSSIEEAAIMALEVDEMNRQSAKEAKLLAKSNKAPLSPAALATKAAKAAALLKNPKVEKPKKAEPVTVRSVTGLSFSDEDDEYDVPFVEEPRWYRLLVRKNSEATLAEKFKLSSEAGAGQWHDVLFDSFYPKSILLKFKGRKMEPGKELSIVYKPMIPGLVFVKMRMDPDIADDVEGVPNVRGFLKSPHGLVLPLSDEEALEVEKLQAKEAPALTEEMSQLRIGEYCSVVGGKHEGKYGIIEGTSKGRIMVRLRSEYKDNNDFIEVENLRYLADPPEVNYKTMSAREAAENLMQKEPNAAILRFLRKEGLLNEILYPERPVRS
ncbi:hypothetical protein B484DRAFT_480232, partial [Ochromonadaceae sp. CCMP2298]